jgi:hypothetical protein
VLAVPEARWRAAGLLLPGRIFANRPGNSLQEEPMLTTAQVDHFRTFGFTVLRGYRADALRAEADSAIRDERAIDGISGHYLPMASRLTPLSASLACDDPRFTGAAQQLLDGPVIPECPEGSSLPPIPAAPP